MKRFALPRNRRWKVVPSVVAAVAAAAVLAPAAIASPPQPAHGSIIFIPGPATLVRTADGNLTYSEQNTALFFGTFTGAASVDLIRTVHTNAGFATFQGSGTYAGAVDGQAGTFDFITIGTGSATAPTFQARLGSIDSGTGGLSTLHTELTLDVPNAILCPFGCTYSGIYHFD